MEVSLTEKEVREMPLNQLEEWILDNKGNIEASTIERIEEIRGDDFFFKIWEISPEDKEKVEALLTEEQLKTMSKTELEEWIRYNKSNINVVILKKIVEIHGKDENFMSILINKSISNEFWKIESFSQILPLLKSETIMTLLILNHQKGFFDDIPNFNIDDNLKKLFAQLDADMKGEFMELLSDNKFFYSLNDPINDLPILKAALSVINNDDEKKLKIVKKYIRKMNYIKENMGDIDLTVIKETLPFISSEGKLSLIKDYIELIDNPSKHEYFFSNILNLKLIDFNNIFSTAIYSARFDDNDKIKFIELLLKNRKDTFISDNIAQKINDIINSKRKPITMEIYHSQASEKAHMVFSKFPVLHETLKTCLIIKNLSNLSHGDPIFPKELHDAVESGKEKDIAKYYGLSPYQLAKIPKSTKHISSLTILEMVKSGLINVDCLPLVEEENKTNVEAQQKALCNVLNACFDLAKELGFEVINKNYIDSYPPFLKNIIRSTAKKGPESWIEIEKSLTKEGLLPVGISDCVDDYTRTVFLPYYLKDKENYDIAEELEEFRPKAIDKFFKDVAIDAICRLSTR